MWTISQWYEDGRKTGERDRAIIRNHAELRLELLKQDRPAAYEATVRDMLGFHRRRMDAVPDLVKYPELRGLRELLLAEHRGLGEAAGLDETQLAAYLSGFDYYHRHIATAPAAAATCAGKANCSLIYFPTSDVGPILANNLDSSPRQMFGPPDWPALNEHLVTGGVSSGVFMDEPSPEIFPAPVFKLVARYCRTAREAVELLTRYNFFWGPGNLLVIDRANQVAMIEKSACRIGVRWSPDGFAFITAMTAEEPGMNAFLADRRAASIKARRLPPGNADEAYWKKQDSRRQLMNELLADARQRPTIESLRRLIQFRDPVRGNVCGFGERYLADGPESECTIRTAIWELRAGRARWWAQQGDTPSWNNRMPDVEYRDVLTWS